MTFSRLVAISCNCFRRCRDICYEFYETIFNQRRRHIFSLSSRTRENWMNNFPCSPAHFVTRSLNCYKLRTEVGHYDAVNLSNGFLNRFFWNERERFQWNLLGKYIHTIASSEFGVIFSVATFFRILFSIWNICFVVIVKKIQFWSMKIRYENNTENSI